MTTMDDVAASIDGLTIALNKEFAGMGMHPGVTYAVIENDGWAVISLCFECAEWDESYRETTIAGIGVRPETFDPDHWSIRESFSMAKKQVLGIYAIRNDPASELAFRLARCGTIGARKKITVLNKRIKELEGVTG